MFYTRVLEYCFVSVVTNASTLESVGVRFIGHFAKFVIGYKSIAMFHSLTFWYELQTISIEYK